MTLTQGNAQRINSYKKVADVVLADDNLVVTNGSFLRIASGVADLSGTGDRIDGISLTLFTFSSTNTTVELQTVNYMPNNGDEDVTWIVDVTNGTLASTDIGSYFTMGANQSLDAGTGSSTTGVFHVKNIFGGGTVAEVSLTRQGS